MNKFNIMFVAGILLFSAKTHAVNVNFDQGVDIKTVVQEVKTADVMAETKSVPTPVVSAPKALENTTKQLLPTITIFCAKRDVSLWGNVNEKGANLGFRIWEPDFKNGGHLDRVVSQTKNFRYEGGDQSGQLWLKLYIPPTAFKLAKNEKFTSILYVLGDGNDTAEKYNLSCVIK